ncbi:MAG: trigger factor [Candidatus Omnitrophica bacterium]|nr:trigger factor [Candidatus Omnitrophota bacterium]
MKIDIERIEPCKRLLKIEVPQDIVSKEFDEVYKDIRKVANVPGFRVGKAPLDILKTHYKEESRKEVLKRLVPAMCIEAMKEKELSPVSEPGISNVELKEDNLLSFHAEVEVEPEVNLKRYKGFKIKKKNIKVTDEDVERVIGSLQDREAEFAAIENRTAGTGDYLDCDMEYTVDSEVIKRNDVRILLGDKRELPGFSEQLTGSKPGDEKKFSLTMPAGDAKSEGAAKVSHFKVSVKGIKEKKLPRIDDEFAMSLGDYKNLEELKKNIRDEIESTNESKVQDDMNVQIINELILNSSFDCPQSMVERHLDGLVKQARNRLVSDGMKKEVVDSKEDTLREHLKERAVREIKVFFLLDKIAKNEGLAVSAEEIDNEIEFRARISGKSADRTKTYLEEKGLMDDLELGILSKKVMDFLLKNSSIEEVET